MYLRHPNFFIVGAPKCGTTAWVEHLGAHHDIGFSNPKEPHYFNEDFPNFRWAKSRDEYLDYFAAAQDCQVIGDASVQYLFSEVAAQKIAEFAPDAKIVIMLRAPAAFIKSYHNQLLMNCDETETDLQAAWDMSGVRLPASIPDSCREPRFLDYKKVGLFSEQVARYFAVFPQSQIKVVFMEDWVRDPRQLYRDLLDFLGLPDDGKTEFPVVHSAAKVASPALHLLSQRPPAGLSGILRWVRMIPGLKGFKPARLIRRFNVQTGYRSKVDSAVMDEITAYFAQDQAALARLVAR